MPDTEKNTDDREELLRHLGALENGITELRKSRNSTLRALHHLKVNAVKSSDQVLKVAQNAGPMTDTFFQLIGEDKKAIGEIISAVLGVSVEVKESVPQYSILNVGSMGVRLDDYAEIEVTAELTEDSELFGLKGTIVDIEVHNQSGDDLENRAFYNGATMIINKTAPRTNYENLPHAIVIFISSFDLYKEGEVLYETMDADVKTKKRRKSPLIRYFVNTESLDPFLHGESERLKKVAALMKVFRDPDWYDGQFPAFSERKKQLRETQEGVTKVSRELQLIVDEMNEEWMKKEAAWNQAIAEKDRAMVEKDRKLFEKDQAIVEKDRAMIEKDRAIAEKDKESADLADAINYLCTEGRGNESARAVNDRVFRENVLREYRRAHEP